MGTTTQTELARWLEPTEFLDFEHLAVAEFAERALDGVDRDDPQSVAVALFLAVRDGIRYDPYNVDHSPDVFRASAVAVIDSDWCVPKSVLLAAAARRQGIPARLGFTDVKNHLTSAKLTESMGTDVFYWHGYAELMLDGRWLKVSSTFNIELCDRFGVKVLDFDGTSDALMHPYDRAGNRHMEYVNQRGSFDDLPYDEIMADFERYYPNIGDADGADTDEAFAP